MASSSPQASESSTRRLRFLGLTAIYSVLIIGAVLITSSLIHDGHGMLGISSASSIAIVIGIGAGLVVALLTAIGTLTEPVQPSQMTKGADEHPRSSRRKCEVDVAEWFALLEEAKKEFYVAGHTMGKWCDPSRRGLFVEQIRRLLAAGGTVTLVALGAESPQVTVLYEATGKNYSGRIATTDAALAELRSSLDPIHRKRLRVKQLDDHGAIPYMVVGNETRLVTATYLARTDSDDVPCIELGRSEKAALAIYDDLHRLAGVGAPGGVSPAAASGFKARLLGRSRGRH